ncbi:NADH-quinone oxidoreductase subunit D, partial [Myxococcota bacterium]|nr:NADH-quinone oxidoreductase subunit D [Myxococcota bacterium]
KFIQAFPIVCRICVPEPDTNEYLLAAALEDIAGLEVPERGHWIRTLILEMSRLSTLLMMLGGQGGEMGMYTPGQWMMALRDHVLDRFEELTGGRVYHMYITYGGVRRDLTEGFAGRMEETLKLIESKMSLLDNVMFDSSVFRTRAQGIGLIKKEWVDEMGIVGPAARAMGVARDVRKDYPYAAYEHLDFDVVTEEGCDIYSRAMVRRREVDQSIDLIRQILKGMPEGPFSSKLPNVMTWTVPKGQTYVRAESSRGEMGYFAVTDGSDKFRRVHVRGPSYVNGTALLEQMIPGMNIADLGATMASLPVCAPEIER